MDNEFLIPFHIDLEQAFKNWMTDPTRLSYIKNLRKAVELVQDATVDQLINGSYIAKRSVCKDCSGTGQISVPVTHPTNPNMDSWTSHPCHCHSFVQRW